MINDGRIKIIKKVIELWSLLIKNSRNISVFILCLLAPIAFALIINLGLIFDIPNQFPSWDGIITYLSIERENSWISNLFLGSITVFIIFFGVAPLTYSMQYIPSHLSRKYILKNKKTYYYFAIEFSFAGVLAFFSHSNTIRNLNIFLCILFLLLSVIVSVCYFYWLTKVINVENFFSLILNKIDFSSLEKVEEPLKQSRDNFKRDLGKFNNLFLTETEKEGEFAFLISHPYRIFTPVKGLVKSININGIYKLLKGIENDIYKIVININIGDSLPRPEYRELPGQTPDSLLLTVCLKGAAIADSADKDEQLEQQILYVKKREIKLIQCFEIDERQNLFYEYSKILDDLLLLYTQVSMSNQIASKYLLQHLESFILKEYFESESGSWETEIGIKQDIFNSTLRL